MICRARQNKHGFSMVELLLGITILSLGILPLFFLGTTSTQQAYDIGRHVLASEVGRAILDRFRSLSFQDCMSTWPYYIEENHVLDDPMFEELLAIPGSEKMIADCRKNLENFTYSVAATYDVPDFPRVMRLYVRIKFPRTRQHDSPITEVVMDTLKFREQP